MAAIPRACRGNGGAREGGAHQEGPLPTELQQDPGLQNAGLVVSDGAIDATHMAHHAPGQARVACQGSDQPGVVQAHSKSGLQGMLDMIQAASAVLRLQHLLQDLQQQKQHTC